jgi:nitrate/TMAO reductase-like tetraheme cytochrome c subunit
MALYAGAGTAMHAVSSEEFCGGACHEMSAFVTPGWQQSPHYRNASGVHAGCPDCHMPGPFVPKMIRKAQALREGYHHILGTISTQEKFDAHRAEMAQRVWTYMKANDSRECRACHSAERMNTEVQSKMAQRSHARAAESGKTCIDCHQGVAHPLPEEPEQAVAAVATPTS